MLIQFHGTEPLYIQVLESVRAGILEGVLGPGTRLPATRKLASDLGVSRNVVLMAFSQLFAGGYVEGRVGAGTFVAAELPDPTFRPAPSEPETAH